MYDGKTENILSAWELPSRNLSVLADAERWDGQPWLGWCRIVHDVESNGFLGVLEDGHDLVVWVVEGIVE